MFILKGKLIRFTKDIINPVKIILLTIIFLALVILIKYKPVYSVTLSGKTLGYVNSKAMEGTILAHVTGNVPNFLIEIDKLDEENIGELIYFFEKAVAMSGNLLGVNPFNQPGVEEYKKNMFRLLEKPGY